jgi:thioredoxin reductase (NADPH)
MKQNDTQTKTNAKPKEEKGMILDILILGGGMAGLTAAIYAARAERTVLVLESKIPGGQITTSHLVENWPTYPEPVGGMELGENLEKQVKRLGVKIEWAIVEHISKMEDVFVVDVQGGKKYFAKAVILATGVDPKEIGVPGEQKFRGRGVSYCATCDGAFYKDRTVIVVGGGDAAVKEAMYLSKIVKKIFLVHRRGQLRAERALSTRLKELPNVEILWHNVVSEIIGEQDTLTGVKIKNVETGIERIVYADGVFVYVGNIPNTFFVKDLITLDEKGFVQASEDTLTNVPGIFVAGDVRSKILRQLVTAAADGATAAHMADHYLG